ncbi:hypothetical protein [Pulveribacter sp.]|uniref:hypothetical protein n=1 Tax=Pulveribacter sp. TaxID=2678893 RepID=UPI0028AAB909|nr:hypothetical protein [Pulveribacter sp.]
MLTTMPTMRRPNPYAQAALASVTFSALLVLALFLSGALLGSGAAINSLLALSSRKYNPFAWLGPENLSNAELGVEMMMGIAILGVSVVLFALSALAIRLLRKP